MSGKDDRGDGFVERSGGRPGRAHAPGWRIRIRAPSRPYWLERRGHTVGRWRGCGQLQLEARRQGARAPGAPAPDRPSGRYHPATPMPISSRANAATVMAGGLWCVNWSRRCSRRADGAVPAPAGHPRGRPARRRPNQMARVGTVAVRDPQLPERIEESRERSAESMPRRQQDFTGTQGWRRCTARTCGPQPPRRPVHLTPAGYG